MELDEAYANAAYIPNAQEFPTRWAQEAAAFRARLGARAQIGLRYGTEGRAVFDLFQPARPQKGTVIFIHGGYWLDFDRSSWSHLAAGPLAHGWAVAMPSYTLCPDIRISDITVQVAQAVQAIAEITEGPLALTGHSAGGHLAARMLAPGLLAQTVDQRVVGAAPISPLGDLEPLLKTTMNAQLGLDSAEARAESPIHQPKPHVAVSVWVGSDERPAFLDQARKLAAAWDAPCEIAEGKHHFNVIDELADPQSKLVQALTQSAPQVSKPT